MKTAAKQEQMIAEKSRQSQTLARRHREVQEALASREALLDKLGAGLESIVVDTPVCALPSPLRRFSPSPLLMAHPPTPVTRLSYTHTHRCTSGATPSAASTRTLRPAESTRPTMAARPAAADPQRPAAVATSPMRDLRQSSTDSGTTWRGLCECCAPRRCVRRARLPPPLSPASARTACCWLR